jgi:hypothetical protein
MATLMASATETSDPSVHVELATVTIALTGGDQSGTVSVPGARAHEQSRRVPQRPSGKRSGPNGRGLVLHLTPGVPSNQVFCGSPRQ